MFEFVFGDIWNESFDWVIDFFGICYIKVGLLIKKVVNFL